MYKVLPFVLTLSCSSLKSFRSDVPDDEPIAEEETELYIPVEAKPLLYMHWNCCVDLCKGKLKKGMTK